MNWTRLGKSLLTAPLHLIPGGAPPPIPPPPGAVRSLIIVRPDERIGNLILITPMIDAARRAWPEAAIDIVVGGAMSGLFRGDSRIREIIVFDKRALVRNVFGLIPISRRLRRARHDLAIDASHSHQFSLTSALLTRATGARWRLGWRRGANERLLNCGLSRDLQVRRYTADLYIDLLRVVAPGAANGRLSLPLSDGERSDARRRLAGAGIPPEAPWIGIHPGGRGNKRWPLERFVEVARRLDRPPAQRVVFFHGPGEAGLMSRIPAGLGTLAPLMPLRVLAAALGECRLFISGDTGPMHLAAAAGAPTFSIFLHGNADMFAPRGEYHRHLHAGVKPSVEAVLDALAAMRLPDGTGVL